MADSLMARLTDDGGFRGRHGDDDLYYTYFALAALDALAVPPPWERTSAFLDACGTGCGLDLAHVCCLARSHNLRPGGKGSALAAIGHLPSFLSPTGGYRQTRGGEVGSIAASFAAGLACEELEVPLAGAQGVRACVSARRARDGAWADTIGLAHGTTTVTAAVALMAAAEGLPCDACTWLRERHVQAGGFLATVDAPGPDLLSTAAALLALHASGVELRPFAEATLGFVAELWAEDGAFRGHAQDAVSDSEFTYYALVAVGAVAEHLR